VASAIEPADGAPYAPTPQLTQSRNLDVEREETELEPALLKHHADAFGWALACCELDRLCCSSQRVAPEKTSYGPTAASGWRPGNTTVPMRRCFTAQSSIPGVLASMTKTPRILPVVRSGP